MREIVHIQAGQCGNQIGAKVGAAPGWGRGGDADAGLAPLGAAGASVVLSRPAARQAQTFPAASGRRAGRGPEATFGGDGEEPLNFLL